MLTIKRFLARYSITTHSIAAAVVFLVAAYQGVPQFRTDVLAVYNLMPLALREAVLDAGLLIGFYKTWRKAGK